MLILFLKIFLNLIAIISAIIVVRKSYNYKSRGNTKITKLGWLVIILAVLSILGTWGLGVLEKKESELKLDAQFRKNEKLLELHKDSITIRVTRDILGGVGNTVNKSTSQIIDMTTNKLLISTKQTIDTIYSYKANTLARIDSINDASMFRQTDISDLVIHIALNVNSIKLPDPGVHFSFLDLANLLKDDPKISDFQLKFITRLFLPTLPKENKLNTNWLYNDSEYRDTFDRLSELKTETTNASIKIIISRNPMLHLHLNIDSNSTKVDMKLYAESPYKKINIPLGKKSQIYKSSKFEHSQWNIIKDYNNSNNLFIVIEKEDIKALFDVSNKLSGYSLLNKDPFVSYTRSSSINGEETFRMSKYFKGLGFNSLSLEITNSAVPQYIINNKIFLRSIAGGNLKQKQFLFFDKGYKTFELHTQDLIEK